MTVNYGSSWYYNIGSLSSYNNFIIHYNTYRKKSTCLLNYFYFKNYFYFYKI